MFVAEDSSPDLFNQITRIHRLMPYSVMKGILRWSNPVAIMKGIIDLFWLNLLGSDHYCKTYFIWFFKMISKVRTNKSIPLKSIISKILGGYRKGFEGYLKASLAVREEIRVPPRLTITYLLMTVRDTLIY